MFCLYSGFRYKAYEQHHHLYMWGNNRYRKISYRIHGRDLKVTQEGTI